MFIRAIFVGLAILLATGGSGDAWLGRSPVRGAAVSGGGGGGITLLSHGSTQNTGFTNTTAVTIDASTGGPATLILVGMNMFVNTSDLTLTDSQGNSYNNSCGGSGHEVSGCVWWTYASSVSSSLTVTATASLSGNMIGWMGVAAFKGTVGTTVDQVSDTPPKSPGGSSTCQTTSITPGHNNELIFTDAFLSGDGGGQTYTIDSGMTRIDWAPQVGGPVAGGLIGYKVQTTAAAIAPTVTDTAFASQPLCQTDSFQ